MKRIIYIITSLLPLVNGCTKTESSPAPEKYDRYIFFSQGVETKASLIEKVDDLAGQQFGVVGFKYQNTSTWDAVNATATPTPNVFFDDDNQPVDDVEECRCSVEGTNASYSPLQGWSNSKKYAFFAYYPINNGSVTLVNLDGTSYSAGPPAIKYTMNTTDPSASMVDVMTADPHTNKYWNSSADNNVTNGEVEFTFAHRLSCLGLNIKNSSAADITISSVVLNITDIRYSNIIIPLDGTNPTPGGSFPSSASFSMNLLDNERIPGSEGVEIADKLIFIPQSDNISVSLTITYKRKYEYAEEYNDTFSTKAPVTTALTEDKKHIIYIDFADSNTYVMIKNNNRDDGPNVNHEFN